jgi:hypothetical protein
MGHRQSTQRKPTDPLIGTSISVTPHDLNKPLPIEESFSPPPPKRKRRSRLRRFKSNDFFRRGNRGKSNKLVIVTHHHRHHPAANDDNDDNDALSPSGRTQPETPASLIMEPSTPKSLVSMMLTATAGTAGKCFTPTTNHQQQQQQQQDNNVYYDEEDDDDDHIMMQQQHQHQHHGLSPPPPPSLLLAGLDNVMIPEEVDPDAPSDEEESYQRVVVSSTNNHHHKVNKWEMEPGPIFSAATAPQKAPTSPPRPQSSIKRRHKRVTRANSIQRHHTSPLVAPGSAAPPPKMSRGSVDRSTMAEFNKLKVQVQLKEHEVKVNQRQKKLEDRYEDVHKSRTMYKDFVDMQDTVSVASAATDRSTNSFDLKDTNAWYYDFGSVVGSDEDDDSDDEKSQYSHQSQYSLLSTASMESQRKFYAAKRMGTATKIDQLEATLKRLNAAKNNGSTNDKAPGDYGPRTVRRLSINSDYGPAQECDASSVSDYGPLSRSNSVRSLPVDYGRLAVNDDAISKASASKKEQQPSKEAMQEYLVDLKEMIDTPVRSETAEVPSNDLLANFLSPGRSITTTEASPFSVMKRSSSSASRTPERISSRQDAPPSDEKSLVCAVSNSSPTKPAPTKALSSTPPSNTKPPTPGPPFDEKKRDMQEKEKEDDTTRRRSPHWRSFQDNSPSNHKMVESPSKPLVPQKVGSIFTMSTEEFLLMADDNALGRISKVSTDKENTVVKARRLHFADDEGST